MSANDRFQIVDAPQRAPGQCFICRSVSRGPFVDTRVDDSFLGVFYVCLGCLHDMAESAELVLIPKAEQIESEPETDSDAFKRGWRAASSALSDIVKDFNDNSDAYRTGDLDAVSSDPDDAPVYGTPSVSPDSSGQEGSGTSASDAPVEDSRPAKRKGSPRVSVDSGDGPGFRV